MRGLRENIPSLYVRWSQKPLNSEQWGKIRASGAVYCQLLLNSTTVFSEVVKFWERVILEPINICFKPMSVNREMGLVLSTVEITSRVGCWCIQCANWSVLPIKNTREMSCQVLFKPIFCLYVCLCVTQRKILYPLKAWFKIINWMHSTCDLGILLWIWNPSKYKKAWFLQTIQLSPAKLMLRSLTFILVSWDVLTCVFVTFNILLRD